MRERGRRSGGENRVDGGKREMKYGESVAVRERERERESKLGKHARGKREEKEGKKIE